MKPVTIKSRDNLELVSYLTTPLGVKPEKLPMVLLVHGGPWARDSWGFASLHQLLANRGYAVLSVNYRGSTGFGKAFVAAGEIGVAERLLARLRPGAALVTVGDFHPATLSWLGAVAGNAIVPLGVDRFGQ